MVNSKVDATVADGGAEPAMPVGTMNGIATVVVHCVGHIGDIVARAFHVGVAIARLNGKDARLCWSGGLASGDQNGVYGCFAFPGDQSLAGQIDFDPALSRVL